MPPQIVPLPRRVGAATSVAYAAAWVPRVGQPTGSGGAARVLRVRHPCPSGDPAGEHRGHRARRNARWTLAVGGARAVNERSTASTEDFMTRHSLATSAFLITAALTWP